MRRSSNDILAPFLERPPSLGGGLRFDIAPQGDGRALVVVHSDGHIYRGNAAVLSVPHPSGLRRLLANAPDLDAVLVERASPGLHRAAEDLGVGYLDLEGHGRLVGPGFVYVVPPPAGRRRPGARDAPVARRASAFAPKASRVARALLAAPGREWRLSEIADAAHMNPGNVHRILRDLADLGAVERDGNRHLLADPGLLLDAWALQPPRPRRIAEIRVSGDLANAVHEVVARLGGNGVVSGELAAERLAPHLPARSAIVHCWDAAAFDDAAQSGDLRGDGRIRLMLSDPSVAHGAQDIDGTPLAAPVQVYLDLHDERGRGRQAAEHLRAELLRI